MKVRNVALIFPIMAVLSAAVWSQMTEPQAVANVERVREAIPALRIEPKRERKLLVFSVTRGYRHGSIGIGKEAFRLLGEETGAYEAVISDDLDHFEVGRIEQFDAICFLNTTHEVFRPSPLEMLTASAEKVAAVELREARLKRNLIQFVEDGGGFVGIHAASDTFYQWKEYGELLGAYFDGHPWHANTQVSIKVDAAAVENPIVAGVAKGELDFKEEIYQFKAPYDSAKLEVLLRLDTESSDMNVRGVKRSDGDFGVSWAKRYGKGRVFYCALGHNEHIYWNPTVLSIYLNGVRWSMGDWD